jgi:hypothetical protein
VHFERIDIFSGNAKEPDGRIFSTTVINVSTDFGANFARLGYFQSDPSGTINSPGNPNNTFGTAQRATRVSIFNDSLAVLARNVTNIEFLFFSVDNGDGQMRDPFDGVNPFTGVDDDLSAAFVSPAIWEIDFRITAAGDLNHDRLINFGDLTPFVLVLTDLRAYLSMYCLFDCTIQCDISGDGLCNFGDLTPFANLFDPINLGTAALAAVPEPSAAILFSCLSWAAFGLAARTRRGP